MVSAASRKVRLGRVAAASVLIGICLVPPARAQTARLLRNLDTTNASSHPQPRLAVGPLLYFTAQAASYGEEVFLTDGTATGTRLLADVNPGAASSRPEGFTELDGLVFFTAADALHGRELWRSDGTAAGTFRLTDVRPGPADGVSFSAGAHASPALGAVLFFGLGETLADRRPWRSDGTVGGTYPLADVSWVHGFSELNGVVYFSAGAGAAGVELWTTDGTPAGTTLFKDLDPAGSSRPFFLGDEVGGQLFFAARDALHGEELWRTDGTTAGTALVRDIYPGVEDSDIREGLGEADGKLLFAARHPGSGTELWISDGTEAGTRLLADIFPGPPSSCCLDPMVPAGGQLFFPVFSDGDVFGSELWKTDGTEAGTTLVRDIVPGPAGSSPFALTPFGDQLAFGADDAAGVRRLWRTDGTEAGTVEVGSPAEGGLSSILGVLAGGLILGAGAPAHGTEPWRSDGSAAGTAQIKDINPGPEGSFPQALTAVGGVGYFAAGDGSHGVELWKTDGTEGGTALVGDLNQGDESSNPLFFRAAGELAYFFAGRELWRTDGTAAGTLRLASGCSFLDQTVVVGDRFFFQRRGRTGAAGGIELWVVGEGSPPARVKGFSLEAGARAPYALTPVGDLAVFLAGSRELWRTDGTEQGTYRLATLSSGSSLSETALALLPEPPPLPGILPYGNRAVVVSTRPDLSASELWLTDGTLPGTRLVTTLPGEACRTDSCSGVLAGELYFYFDDGPGAGAYGAELWKTDGTAAGTRLAVDIVPGSESSYPAPVVRAGGRLFLPAETDATGRELWVTDGTAAGTGLVADLYPGSRSSGIDNLVELDGDVLFTARHPDHGHELWRSDGSAAGTFLLKDIHPDPEWPSRRGADQLENLGGLVLFIADDGSTGQELWRTDGTAAGTYLLQDLEPGPEGSTPREFTLVGGDKVVFAATVQPEGRELWVLDDWRVDHRLELAAIGSGAGRAVATPPGIECATACGAQIGHLDAVVLAAVPDAGSRFAGWSGHSDCADGRLRMDGARSCAARFEPCSAAEILVAGLTVRGLRVFDACGAIAVGPGVTVESGGRLVLRAAEGVRILDAVEVRPGGRLTVESDGAE